MNFSQVKKLKLNCFFCKNVERGGGSNQSRAGFDFCILVRCKVVAWKVLNFIDIFENQFESFNFDMKIDFENVAQERYFKYFRNGIRLLTLCVIRNRTELKFGLYNRRGI